MSAVIEGLPVLEFSSEEELEKRARAVGQGLIVVKRPTKVYPVLKRAVENWSAFHVQPSMGSLSPALLQAARALIIERKRVGGLPTRFNRMKEVSRRDLLSRFAIVREGFCGPVKGSIAKSLSNGAAEVLSGVCPYGALENLEVRGRSCRECGVCYSFLPAGVLESPLLPFQAARSLLQLARTYGWNLSMLYFELAREEEAYEAVLESGVNVLAIPLAGGLVPWWLPLLHSVYGVQGVVLSSRSRYLEYVFADAEVLTRGELKLCTERTCARDELKSAKTLAYREIQEATEQRIIKLALSVSPRALAPGSSMPPRAVRSFVLRVSQESCILCGACVRSCPYEALFMETEPRTPRLILRANMCQGCWNCATVCPTGAITGFDPLLLGAEQVLLVQDELVNCVHCGAPVGPRRRVEHVEKRLAESGMEPETVRTMVRVCASCRTSRTLSSG